MRGMPDMGSLANPKYEMVAQGVARGLSQLKACRAAGFEMKTHGPACRVCKRPEVMARIMELQTDEVELREARDRIRKTTIRNGTPGQAVTQEYVLLELQQALLRARSLGSVREEFRIITMIAKVAGILAPGKPGRPPGPAKNKREQTRMNEPDPEMEEDANEDDSSADNGGAREISEVDRLLGRLGDVAGDDDQAPGEAAHEGAGNPHRVDGDV